MFGLALRSTVRATRLPIAPVPRRGMAHGPPAKLLKNLQEGSVEWWAKYTPSYGFVTRQMSPYQLDPMKSLFTDLPHKIKHKLEKPIFDVLPALLLLVGTITWAESDFERRGREHWH